MLQEFAIQVKFHPKRNTCKFHFGYFVLADAGSVYAQLTEGIPGVCGCVNARVSMV